MFRVEVEVMLRSAILDVEGKTVAHALGSLGYGGVNNVRIGKHITFDLDCDTAEEAESIAAEIAQKVLSNPVMEDYVVQVEAADLKDATAEESA